MIAVLAIAKLALSQSMGVVASGRSEQPENGDSPGPGVRRLL